MRFVPVSCVLGASVLLLASGALAQPQPQPLSTPPPPAAAQPPPAYGQPQPQPPPGYGQPPPGYGPPPPGYGPPPPGYGPPGYYPPPGPYYYYPPPGPYYGQPGGPMAPPEPKERRSTGMMVTGIVLAGIGGLGFIVGVAVYSTAESRISDCAYVYDYGAYGSCDDDSDERQAAGIGMMIAGGALLAVGIPLAVVGGRKVSTKSKGQPEPEVEEASLVPELRMSTRSAALRWAF
jgi:hypothetical protein